MTYPSCRGNCNQGRRDCDCDDIPELGHKVINWVCGIGIVVIIGLVSLGVL